MADPRPKLSIGASAFPTVGPDTRFHIDYDWWERSNMSLQAYLQTSLGGDIVIDQAIETVDMIDPHTGEVRQVSGFEYTLQLFFRQLPANYVERLSLIDACFCVLLANGNRPMKASEIATEIGRSPDIVFRTLRGPRIYKGIRPLYDD
jgi:hypothetical protein